MVCRYQPRCRWTHAVKRETLMFPLPASKSETSNSSPFLSLSGFLSFILNLITSSFLLFLQILAAARMSLGFCCWCWSAVAHRRGSGVDLLSSSSGDDDGDATAVVACHRMLLLAPLLCRSSGTDVLPFGACGLRQRFPIVSIEMVMLPYYSWCAKFEHLKRG